jgi:hypothetical protein
MSKYYKQAPNNGKTLLWVLESTQLSKTEHQSTIRPAESEINDMSRYRPTVLTGQDVKYPSYFHFACPNCYQTLRDEIDPRFQPIYKTN